MSVRWNSGSSNTSENPRRFSLPDTMSSSPARMRRSMNRRPNQAASAVPVSSARNAVVTCTRRRQVCWTRTSVTRTRADTTVPSATACRSPSVRSSRRSSYRRGRWNRRSRTVSRPRRRPVATQRRRGREARLPEGLGEQRDRVQRDAGGDARAQGARAARGRRARPIAAAHPAGSSSRLTRRRSGTGSAAVRRGARGRPRDPAPPAPPCGRSSRPRRASPCRRSRS